MKNILLTCTILIAAISGFAQNVLSKKEKKEGWVLLFDGTSTAGWHSYLKSAPGAAWQVIDGTLTLKPEPRKGGDLTTDKEFENYELSIDWKISAGGNSGIIFGVHEDTTLRASYLSGIEMQVLDDKLAQDNKKANHLAGSLYDLKVPSATTVKPAGEWNTAVIWKKDGRLKFSLNGTQILDIQIGGPEWQELVNNSKFKTWANFAKYPKGKIALQDHGHEVSFKNVKIRTL